MSLDMVIHRFWHGQKLLIILFIAVRLLKRSGTGYEYQHEIKRVCLNFMFAVQMAAVSKYQRKF